MAKEKPTWYETPAVQDMMTSLGGKAVRGVMSNYFSANLLTGKVGLIGFSKLRLMPIFVVPFPCHICTALN